MEDNAALSPRSRELIESPDNDIFLSIASVWEMAIKVSLGKLALTQPFELFVPNQFRMNDIAPLDITVRHTLLVATLPFHHRDPFDRLLVAQSLDQQMPLISTDTIFDTYGVTRLW